MAITTYAELQTAAMTSWMDRSDISSLVPDCITLAEASFNRKLRVRQMATSTTLTSSVGALTLPSDFLAVISLVFTSGSTARFLEEREDDTLGQVQAGTPSKYEIFGSTIRTAPYDDTASAFTLRYYQKIPVLSVSNTTNWLLTAHPDLYLFGTLAEAELLTKDGQSGAVWKQRRDEVLDEIQKIGAFYHRGPSPPIRPTRVTP